MKTTENQEQFTKSLEAALAKAWQDGSFKQELIASPAKAIENLTGKKFTLKEGVEMVVVDQSKANTFYFNIPNKPDFDNVELTEEQLELVAGGGIIDDVISAAKTAYNILTMGRKH